MCIHLCACTCECVCKGSEIAQKQNKFEQVVHEMSCGVAEDTFKCPRARNEPFHCPRGHMAAMGRGNMEDGNVENGKCGVISAETKRDVDKRTLRWLDA